MSNKQNKKVNTNGLTSHANAVVAISYNHPNFEEIVPKGAYLVVDCRETGKSMNPKTTSIALAKCYGKHYGIVRSLAFRQLERHTAWLAHAAPAAEKLAELAFKTPIAIIGWNTAHLKAVAQLVAKASQGKVKPILEWEMDGTAGRSLVRVPTDGEFKTQLCKFLLFDIVSAAKPCTFGEVSDILG